MLWAVLGFILLYFSLWPCWLIFVLNSVSFTCFVACDDVSSTHQPFLAFLGLTDSRSVRQFCQGPQAGPCWFRGALYASQRPHPPGRAWPVFVSLPCHPTLNFETLSLRVTFQLSLSTGSRPSAPAFSSPTGKQGMALLGWSSKPLHGPVSPRRQSAYFTLYMAPGPWMVGDRATGLWRLERSGLGRKTE